MQNEYGIAAFRSRQQVLLFEDKLHRSGIDADIMTTPRAIALGCGLSVRFDLRDAERVRTLVQGNRGNLIGLYRVEQAQGSRTRVVPLSRNMQGTP